MYNHTVVIVGLVTNWASGDQDISARIQMFGTPQLARVLLLNIFGYVS